MANDVISVVLSVVPSLAFAIACGAVARMAILVPSKLDDIADILDDIASFLDSDDDPDDPAREDLPIEAGKIVELRKRA